MHQRPESPLSGKRGNLGGFPSPGAKQPSKKQSTPSYWKELHTKTRARCGGGVANSLASPVFAYLPWWHNHCVRAPEMELFLCKSSHANIYLPLAASPPFFREAWISL